MYSFVFIGDEYVKLKVARVTKLHIITEGGHKYKFNGCLAGSTGGNYRYIRLFDQKLYDHGLAAKVHKQKANVLADTRWRDMPTDVVSKAYDLLPRKSEA